MTLALLCAVLPLLNQPASGAPLSDASGPLETASSQVAPSLAANLTFSFSVDSPPSLRIETGKPQESAESSPPPLPVAVSAAVASSTVGTPHLEQSVGSAASAITSPEIGYASWYGSQFQGRLTANGEIYDMNQLTAAHKTLPFGTLVRVTNLSNGASVVVRINDRGPYVDGRIIDLSKEAAEEIALAGAGVSQVRLDIIGSLGEAPASPKVTAQATSEPPTAAPAVPAAVTTQPSTTAASPVPTAASPAVPAAKPSSAATPPEATFTLQIGAFRDHANADRLRSLLTAHAIASDLEESGDILRVVIKAVKSDEVPSLEERLRLLGLGSVLVRSE